MSKNDGHMESDSLYVTSDSSITAYLMLRGYELLGLIDSGEVNQYNQPRYLFGLTSTDPEILRDVNTDVKSKIDEFENSSLSVPHDPTATVNVKQYFINYRTCLYSLKHDKPLRRQE